MTKIFSGLIDHTKWTKSKIVKGAKGGLYSPVTVVLNDTPDQFGNTLIIQEGQNKEEREGRVPKIYLSNCKLIWTDEAAVPAEVAKKGEDPLSSFTGTEKGNLFDDDLPF